VTLYLRVDELIRLTTGSIRVSQVFSGLGKKLIQIEIYKQNLTQLGMNLWWVRLAHVF